MAKIMGPNFIMQQLSKLKYVYPAFSRAMSYETGTKLSEQQNDYKDFNNVFPHIVKTIAYEEDSRLKAVMLHFKEVLEYNVPYGKKNRGIATVIAYKMLNDPKTVAKEQLYLVQVMGWCIELEGVGFSAVNDSILIENALYKLLKMYYRYQPYYINILELFHEVTLKTAYGQSLDLLSSGNKKSLDFSMFTLENYATIVEYKTAYYSFYLPVATALQMSGITNPNIHAQAKETLLQMGHYFQVQDDFLDCFGNPSTTGKLGTDIQDGKCTWLIVNALQKTDERQLKILKDNYGCDDPEGVQRVINLYRELEIPAMYANYEKEVHGRIMEAIQKPTLKLPTSIFEYCLKQIYNRKS